MLIRRPDLSWVISEYFKKFPKNKEAADALLDAIRIDPTYDASASRYIEALDVCEPRRGKRRYQGAIRTAAKRSVERSIVLRIASLTFRGRRSSTGDAVRLLSKEKDPLVRGIVLHRLFDAPDAPFNVAECRDLLRREVAGKDPDLARYACGLLLSRWPPADPDGWKPEPSMNDSAKLLLTALGLRKRGPKKGCMLDGFFKDKMRIAVPISWRKALGREYKSVESKCLRLQSLQSGDPTAFVMILDTFNEALVQSFSSRHPKLSGPYKSAAGKNMNPDFGSWIMIPALSRTLPKGINWLREVHDTRVGSDLAHAKTRKGGKPTSPVQHGKAERLFKQAIIAWAELITEWKTIL